MLWRWTLKRLLHVVVRGSGRRQRRPDCRDICRRRLKDHAARSLAARRRVRGWGRRRCWRTRSARGEGRKKEKECTKENQRKSKTCKREKLTLRILVVMPLGQRRRRPLLRVVRLDGTGGSLGHGDGRQRRDIGPMKDTAEGRGAQWVEVGPKARCWVAASVHGGCFCSREQVATRRVDAGASQGIKESEAVHCRLMFREGRLKVPGPCRDDVEVEG